MSTLVTTLVNAVLDSRPGEGMQRTQQKNPDCSSRGPIYVVLTTTCKSKPGGYNGPLLASTGIDVQRKHLHT